MKCRARFIWALAAGTALLVSGPVPMAQAADTIDCQDILLVGARGSSQLLSQAREHLKLTSLLRAGISGLDFDEVQIGDTQAPRDALDPGGYPAIGSNDWFGVSPPYLELKVRVAPWWTGSPLQLSLDVDKSVMRPYYESMTAGDQQLVSWLPGRAARCPSENYVIDGYSQGAHAMGGALSRLDASVRDRIDFVAFFGDPVAQSPGLWNRGSAGSPNGALNLAGGADRSPYIPTDLQGSAGLWCDTYDGVCNPVEALIRATDDIMKELAKASIIALWTGGPSLDPIIDALSKAHSEYADDNAEVDLAANEILERLRAQHPEWDSNLTTTLIPLKPGVTPKVDVAFVIDTTGSMWDDIAAAKNSASQIASAVLTLPDARVQLVQYRDYGDAFQAETVVPFTNDSEQFTTGLDSLVAGGGGDWPESVYSGLMKAFEADWRPGARKLAVILGDAPAHDPEPGTGYTLNDVTSKAFALDPVVIDGVVIGGSWATSASFKALADASGGNIYSAATAGEVADSLLKSVNDFKSSPVAVLAGPYPTEPNETLTAPLNEALTFSAVGSFDPDSAIQKYEWDFNADGLPDVTGADPVVQHNFATEFEGLVSVTVTSFDGGRATATLPVKAFADAVLHTAPSAPQEVSLTGDQVGQKAVLKWQDPASDGGEALTGFLIADGDGRPLALATPGATSVEIPWTGKSGLTVQIGAMNRLGLGALVAKSIDAVVVEPTQATVSPSSAAPSSAAPSSAAPSSAAPSSAAPSTQAPAATEPSTGTQPTIAPASSAPATDNRAVSAVLVKSSVKKAKLGSEVTLTAIVTGPSTGNVNFRDSGHKLGSAPISAGKAILVTKRLYGGVQKITATFAGDSEFKPSTGTVKVRVKDTTLPRLTLNTPGRTTPSANPSVSWVAKDRGGVRAVLVSTRIGGVKWSRPMAVSPSATPYSLSPLTEGTKLCVKATAVDWAGNVAKREIRCTKAE